MIEIIGGSIIDGEVEISGSKNAALPIICAALLTKGLVILKNVPEIEDVKVLLEIIKELNVDIEFNNNVLKINSKNIKYKNLINSNVSKIRASSYLLSIMLVLFKKVKLAYPGGCSIGQRGLDYHVNSFKALGASIYEKEYIEGSINLIKENSIFFKNKSVGATINTVILAGLSTKIIKIFNYSKEPEVMHTISFLRMIGYKIYEFKDYLAVAGRKFPSKKYKFKIPFDRIEAISYILLGTKAKSLTIKNINIKELAAPLDILNQMKVKYILKNNKIIVNKSKLSGVKVEAKPYPAFPTDALPLLASCLLDSPDESAVVDNVYPNRINYTKGLLSMQANLKFENNILYIKNSILYGAVVKGYDLRGVFSLIIAASNAIGKTTILDGEIAFRGYEKLLYKLNKIGIKAKRI